jgi:hypothetical protein
MYKPFDPDETLPGDMEEQFPTQEEYNEFLEKTKPTNTPEHAKEFSYFLCEQNYIILKPNRFYYFIVGSNCKTCLQLQKEGQP